MLFRARPLFPGWLQSKPAPVALRVGQPFWVSESFESAIGPATFPPTMQKQSLSRRASLAHLSESRFSRIFKQISGMTGESKHSGLGGRVVPAAEKSDSGLCG